MIRTLKLFSLGLACIIVASAATMCQTNAESAQSSLGIRAGFSWTRGDWVLHRFAPGVTLFKGSTSIEGDLEFRVGEKTSLAVDGGYMTLDAGDWEHYARAQGDVVRASASLTYAGIVVRPYLKVTKPDIIKIDIGPVMLFADGNESFKNWSYSYDFFKSIKFGVQGAIEYDRFLSEAFSVTLRVGGFVVPSGVEYADGDSRAVVAFPVTLGIRLSY